MDSIQMEQEYEKEVGKAEEELNNRNYDSAKDLLQYVLKQNPTHLKASILLGQVYLEEENISMAIHMYETIKKEYPLVLDGYYYLGSIYNMIGYFEKAIQEFDFVLGLDAFLVEAVIGKAMALSEMGNTADGLSIIEKSLQTAQQKEEKIKLKEAKAVIYFEYQNDQSKALKICEELLQEDPFSEVAVQISHLLK